MIPNSLTTVAEPLAMVAATLVLAGIVLTTPPVTVSLILAVVVLIVTLCYCMILES